MGFNPFRDSDKSVTDIAIMAIGLAVALGAIAWAIFSG